MGNKSNKGGCVNMRNTNSIMLIRDDDAGATIFGVLGISTAVVGLLEQCIIVPFSIGVPAISSAIGATLGSLCTWAANILTA